MWQIGLFSLTSLGLFLLIDQWSSVKITLFSVSHFFLLFRNDVFQNKKLHWRLNISGCFYFYSLRTFFAISQFAFLKTCKDLKESVRNGFATQFAFDVFKKLFSLYLQNLSSFDSVAIIDIKKLQLVSESDMTYLLFLPFLSDDVLSFWFFRVFLERNCQRINYVHWNFWR